MGKTTELETHYYRITNFYAHYFNFYGENNVSATTLPRVGGLCQWGGNSNVNIGKGIIA